MTSDGATKVADKTADPDDRGLLGWPRWFVTLFGTDLWERFSFYGMAALLFLFAAEPKASGGLGLGNSTAAALFGVYLSTVFMASLPGGWLGDRVFGARRATLYGGVLIALGHLTMALPTTPTFFTGLLLLAAGTGLLKPNLATMLSAFYPKEKRAERDAGFSIFYMSIQISAVIAPIVTGLVGELVNWHLGFGVAALGMALGLLQYVRGRAHFRGVGEQPERPATGQERKRVLLLAATLVGAVIAILGTDTLLGTFQLRHALMLAGLCSLIAPIAYFSYLLRHPELSPVERGQIRAYIWVFLTASMFWMIFVQGGSVFSLFAKVSTDRSLGGFTLPASWFQSTAPLCMLLVAPLFARLWVRLGNRIGAPVKFAMGLWFMGLSLLVMAGATIAAADGARVTPLWLLAAYFLMACGEIVFAPVGMSVTTRVAPAAFVSQMIGVFWLAAALGAGLGSQIARFSEKHTPGPGYFLGMGLVAISLGTALAAFAGPLRRRLES
ncbi:peptide MFS transporter [Streptomyces sp. NBC_01618]|uniref:peptide MFS transporter n=1 Tax=Streptomyces sp. NBC_01618 TaxID=2975900 RepID=UPI00387007D3|nr:oligopeptide:H+ symporter [Streptomyces sp. NBC_01618]